MREFRAAYRYALSIIDVAREIKKVDDVSKDFEMIEKLLNGGREFLLFLKSPIVSKEKKKQILKQICKGKVSELTMRFILLLTSKGREELLPETIQQFYCLRDERLGILNVTVKMAIPLTGSQKIYLTQQLEQVTRKKVRVNYILEPSLQGGFTILY